MPSTISICSAFAVWANARVSNGCARRRSIQRAPLTLWHGLQDLFCWRLYSSTAELYYTCQSVRLSGRSQHIYIDIAKKPHPFLPWIDVRCLLNMVDIS